MSQPNSITLSVDTDNDGGTTAAVDTIFTNYSRNDNSSKYISDNHEIDARDLMQFFRTPPKPNGFFRGVARSAIRFTKDFTVLAGDLSTTTSAPATVECKFTFPVGMTDAQRKEMRMRLVAALLDDTVMDPLHDQLLV